MTVRDLLLHDSGLPPDPAPGLWKTTKNRKSGIESALATDLAAAPGDTMVYSDINAMTLATILEKLYHERIVSSSSPKRVTQPLGLMPHALPATQNVARRNRVDRDREDAVPWSHRAAWLGAR